MEVVQITNMELQKKNWAYPVAIFLLLLLLILCYFHYILLLLLLLRLLLLLLYNIAINIIISIIITYYYYYYIDNTKMCIIYRKSYTIHKERWVNNVSLLIKMLLNISICGFHGLNHCAVENS